jgi:hypothetical protein
VRLADVPRPASAVADRARDAAAAYCSDAIMQHNHRSYLWAASYGVTARLPFDAELLYVAAMLHDLGLVRAFDNELLPFEEAGGHVAWMFAAGAGWPVERRVRAAEVVERHMWAEVDPASDVEGHLLEVGTGLDISGRGIDRWPPELRADVLSAHPRLDLATEFLACFEDQARRKPGSSAAAAVRGGVGDRLLGNPLEPDA